MTPYYQDSSVTLYCGDSREIIPAIETVQCCVTSPPYFGLRDYGKDAQIGQEATPAAYVESLVAVFESVRAVLAQRGTLWLNLGDSYAGSGRGLNGDGTHSSLGTTDKQATNRGSMLEAGFHEVARQAGVVGRAWVKPPEGLKQKDLIGIPWMVAFALRSAGWYLRSDIIWAKPNPMPESVLDRPTKSHEYLFLMSKSGKYYYDAESVRTQSNAVFPSWEERKAAGEGPRKGLDSNRGTPFGRGSRKTDKQRGHSRRHAGFNDRWDAMEREQQIAGGANIRSVWNVATAPFKGAHFATFPPKLIEPCIKAGSAEGDTVLDPFFGAGTTGLVAKRLGRKCIGIELNEAYCEIAAKRLMAVNPLFDIQEAA